MALLHWKHESDYRFECMKFGGDGYSVVVTNDLGLVLEIWRRKVYHSFQVDEIMAL